MDSLLEILSERMIKPSSPTPPSLRSHKLSYKDQMMHNKYVPWAFFYPSPCNKDHIFLSGSEISQLLRTSLSKTLTYYYPFAGRLKNSYVVDCNDAGVEFTEARIKLSMTEILKPENSHLRDLVFPRRLFSTDRIAISPTERSLLIVQGSFFDCGGVAVSLCGSHKLMDASTTCCFMHDWSAMSAMADRGFENHDHVPTPLFNGASVFPPVEDDNDNLLLFHNELKDSPPQAKCITRRFLFHSSKIDELKTMAVNSSKQVQNPTRFEVVTALLFRTAIMAASKANSGFFKPSILFNAVNLRSLLTVPKDSVGNFLTSFTISATTERQMEFPDLVHHIRYEKSKMKATLMPFAKIRDDQKADHLQQYYCNSWCGFPFYLVDFGFGKPLVVSDTDQTGAKNRFFLRDTSDGEGIEAIVTLDPIEMSFFQVNQELLAFGSQELCSCTTQLQQNWS